MGLLDALQNGGDPGGLLAYLLNPSLLNSSPTQPQTAAPMPGSPAGASNAASWLSAAQQGGMASNAPQAAVAPSAPAPMPLPSFASGQFDPATYAPAQTGLPNSILAAAGAGPANIGASSVAPATPFGAPIFAKPAVAATTPAGDDDDDEPAKAAPAVAQASPIQFGGRMMQRIGPASAYAPDPAAIPANAQPGQAQPIGGPAASPGIGDHVMAGLQGLTHGNSVLGSLVDGVHSLITGQREDEQGVAQRQQAVALNSTVQALKLRGVDPVVTQAALAQAAAGDRKPLETLWDSAFKQKDPLKLENGYVLPTGATKAIRVYEPDDKFQHVNVKNPDGSETPASYDPSTGKYTLPPAPPPGKFSVDPSLTGKDRLEALRAVDPLYARKIESLVAGDLPMPTGVAALRPESKRMTEDALAVDGSTSASDFQTRAATRKDYASGIASRVTKSINTTIGHFATLDQAVDKLGNYSYFPKVANAVHDAYSSNMDPEYQKAKATFETNKEAAVKELDFALSGGHSSVSGSAELRDKFNRADSPEALHAAVTEAMSLLQKRLESHTKAFNEGTKSQRDAQDFIYPENQQAFGKMLGQPGAAAVGGAPGAGTAASAKPASVTQNGHVYNLQSDGSYK
jgi:hypothetical protein